MSLSTGTNDPQSVNRKEFRQVLRKVLETLRGELNLPGISPFNPDELAHWFRQITTEDIQAVWADSHKQRIPARKAAGIDS